MVISDLYILLKVHFQTFNLGLWYFLHYGQYIAIKKLTAYSCNSRWRRCSSLQPTVPSRVLLGNTGEILSGRETVKTHEPVSPADFPSVGLCSSAGWHKRGCSQWNIWVMCYRGLQMNTQHQLAEANGSKNADLGISCSVSFALLYNPLLTTNAISPSSHITYHAVVDVKALALRSELT